MHYQAATEKEAHGVLHEKCNGGNGGVACPGRGATVAGVLCKKATDHACNVKDEFLVEADARAMCLCARDRALPRRQRNGLTERHLCIHLQRNMLRVHARVHSGNVGCMPHGNVPRARATNAHACKQEGHTVRVQRNCTNAASTRATAMPCTNGVYSTCTGVKDAPTMRACSRCTNGVHAHATDGWRTIQCFATHSKRCSRR